MKHLIINDLIFVDSEESMVETLFSPINGKTAVGTFLKTGRKYPKIHLYNASGQLFACILKNKQGYFIVNATMHNEEIFYQNALSSNVEEWLGLSRMSRQEEQSFIKEIIDRECL